MQQQIRHFASAALIALTSCGCATAVPSGRLVPEPLGGAPVAARDQVFKQIGTVVVTQQYNTVPPWLRDYPEAGRYVWLELGLREGISNWPAKVGLGLPADSASSGYVKADRLYLVCPEISAGGERQGWNRKELGGETALRIEASNRTEARPRKGPYAGGEFFTLAVAGVLRENARGHQFHPGEARLLP